MTFISFFEISLSLIVFEYTQLSLNDILIYWFKYFKNSYDNFISLKYMMLVI